MHDNQQESEVSEPRYWRLFELAAATIYVASIGTVIAILRYPEWHDHLLRLMVRAFDVFVTQDVGSTGRGFFNAGLEVVLGAGVVAIMTGLFLGSKSPRKDRVETAIITLVSFATVALVVYGSQFAWEVARVGYYDHQTLVAKVSSLGGENSHLVDPSGRDSTITNLQNQLKETQSQLATRKQMFVVGDPAFDNIRKVLSAFQSYRLYANGRHCFVYITSPSPSPIVTALSELSNSVSSCSTSSSEGRMSDRQADSAVRKGMIDGVVLLHAPKGDTGAGRIEEYLSGTLPLERSSDPYPEEASHYQNESKGDLVIWLQFGPNVRWTSDHSKGR